MNYNECKARIYEIAQERKIAAGSYTAQQMRKELPKDAESTELFERLALLDKLNGTKTTFLIDAPEMNEPDAVMAVPIDERLNDLAKCVGKEKNNNEAIKTVLIEPNGRAVASNGFILISCNLASSAIISGNLPFLVPERICKHKSCVLTMARKGTEIRGRVLDKDNHKIDAFIMEDAPVYPRWRSVFPNKVYKNMFKLNAEQMAAFQPYIKAHERINEPIIFTTEPQRGNLNVYNETSGATLDFATETSIKYKVALSAKTLGLLPKGDITFHANDNEHANIFEIKRGEIYYVGLLMPVLCDNVQTTNEQYEKNAEKQIYDLPGLMREDYTSETISQQGAPKNEVTESTTGQEEKENEKRKMEQHAAELVAELREMAKSGITIHGVTFTGAENEPARTPETEEVEQVTAEQETEPQNEENTNETPQITIVKPQYAKMNFPNGNECVVKVEDYNTETVKVTFKGGYFLYFSKDCEAFKQLIPTNEKKCTLPEWVKPGTKIKWEALTIEITKVAKKYVFLDYCGTIKKNIYTLLYTCTPYVEQPKKQNAFARILRSVTAIF